MINPEDQSTSHHPPIFPVDWLFLISTEKRKKRKVYLGCGKIGGVVWSRK